MVLAALFVWFVFSSSLLADVRGHLAETLLSRKLGHSVRIDGGVWVDPGADLHVTAERLFLPSPSIPDIDLASVQNLTFRIPLRDLLRGRANVHDVSITGSTVTLLAQQDGTSSWSPAQKTKAGGGANLDRQVLGFLNGRRISFADISVTYQDARNGLDLDLSLDTLDLGQGIESEPSVVVQGKGKLNGQDMVVSGGISAGHSLKLKTTFKHVEIDIRGSPDPEGIDKGFSMDGTAAIADLNQVLEIFKLAGPVNGTGKITASLHRTSNGGAAEGNVAFELVGGESLTVSADIKDLANPKDAAIMTRLKLYPEGKEPPTTRSRRDLKLLGIDMDLTSRPGQPPLRSMVIATNGFILDTGGVGPPPISVAEIARTDGGKLQIGQAELRIGPPEHPILVLNGLIGDLLALDGFDFDGVLDMPAGNLIAPDQLQDVEELGRLTGSFKLTGNTETLKLSGLKVASKATDLWNIDASGSAGNILVFDTVELTLAARTASTSTFLKALDLKQGKDVPVKFDLQLNSQDLDWKSTATVSVAESKVASDLTLQADEDRPIARGSITSDLIRISHLQEIIRASVQLAKLDQPQSGEPASQKTGKQQETGGDQDAVAGPFRNVTLRPIGQAILLSGMDVDINVELNKVQGKNGSGKIDGDLIVEKHEARLGPVKFSYGGGQFDVSAAMNMAESPDVLSLKGSTSGWDFARILELLKVKKNASGTLSATFDVSGKHASFKRYLRTMSGHGTVSMRNGSIDSQLLDLAGLGVVPWLFEKGRKNTAVIACLRAPLSVSGGRFTLKNGVVETPKVQVVVQGELNLNDDTVNISGQPRRIGHPLSRSPWPFRIAGPLKNPKVKVKDGPKRLRRADGASTMPARRKICVPDIYQLK